MSVLDEVKAERERQKSPVINEDHFLFLAHATGSIKACLEMIVLIASKKDIVAIRSSFLQIAALAIAAVESIDRRGNA